MSYRFRVTVHFMTILGGQQIQTRLKGYGGYRFQANDTFHNYSDGDFHDRAFIDFESPQQSNTQSTTGTKSGQHNSVLLLFVLILTIITNSS